MRHDALQDFGEIDFLARTMSNAAATVLAFPDVMPVTALDHIGTGESLFVEIECDGSDAPTVTSPGVDVYYVMNFALVLTDESTFTGILNAGSIGALEVIGRSGDWAAVDSDPTIGGAGDFSVGDLAAGRKILVPVPPLPRDIAITAKPNLGVMAVMFLASGSLDLGKIHARMVLSGQLDHVYAGGFSIT